MVSRLVRDQELCGFDSRLPDHQGPCPKSDAQIPSGSYGTAAEDC
jgi:hypothetical protein